MFTGIITDIGEVVEISGTSDIQARIACDYDVETIDIGASIACSGVCLTVVEKAQGWFKVDISAETTSKTTARIWTKGTRLNLERALKVGDELGGQPVVGGDREGAGSDGGGARNGADRRRLVVGAVGAA